MKQATTQSTWLCHISLRQKRIQMRETQGENIVSPRMKVVSSMMIKAIAAPKPATNLQHAHTTR